MFKRLPRGSAVYGTGRRVSRRAVRVAGKPPARAAAVGGKPTEAPRVPSPGGWTPPAGARAGWDWTPPAGAVPRPDRLPWAVRVWWRVPWVDRFAYRWMWTHGGFDVVRRS